MYLAYSKEKDSNLTHYDEWIRIKEKTGTEVDELKNKPNIDSRVKHLWDEFVNIKSGCENIGYVEINAYESTTLCKFNRWEISVLLELDKIRRSNGW